MLCVMAGGWTGREGGLRYLEIVRDEGLPIDQRERAALRVITITEVASEVIAEAQRTDLPEPVSRTLGCVVAAHMQTTGPVDPHVVAGLAPIAREEAERILRIPPPPLPPAKPAPPPKATNARGVPELDRPTGVTLLVGLTGRTLLGRYSVDDRTVERAATVVDRFGVAIDSVIERETWFATTAGGVICSVPRDLSHPGQVLAASSHFLEAFPLARAAEHPDLLWVGPPGDGVSAVIDAAGTVHEWRPGFSEADWDRAHRPRRPAGGEDGFELREGALRQVDERGNVLRSVELSRSRGGLPKAAVSPDGRVVCVVQRVDDDEDRPGWPAPAGVWLVETDTFESRQITGHLDTSSSTPVWSRDAQWVFVHCAWTPRAGLWAINVEEGLLRLVQRGMRAPWPLAVLDN